MKRRLASILLFFVGVLNLTPAIVFFAPSRSSSLYGIDLAADNFGIIVRHRAVLLGLLGAAMIYAAFRQQIVVPVVLAALVGKTAFLYLVWMTGFQSIEMERVAMFDVGAIVALLAALALHFTSIEHSRGND